MYQLLEITTSVEMLGQQDYFRRNGFKSYCSMVRRCNLKELAIAPNQKLNSITLL